MKRRLVDVTFAGTVEVFIPDHLSEDDADLLAEKFAIARIVATTDNMDGPEDDACDDAIEQGKNITETDWDNSRPEGVCGDWKATGVRR